MEKCANDGKGSFTVLLRTTFNKMKANRTQYQTMIPITMSQGTPFEFWGPKSWMCHCWRLF